MSDFVIEKGIEIPGQMYRGAAVKYPWADMEIGDSFLVSVDGDRKEIETKRKSFHSAAYQAGRRLGRKYVTRTVEGGVRIWRFA